MLFKVSQRTFPPISIYLQEDSQSDNTEFSKKLHETDFSPNKLEAKFSDSKEEQADAISTNSVVTC